MYIAVTGLVHLIQLPPASGQDLVIMTTFDMKAMMEVIVRFRCTELWLVPPLLIRLLNDRTAQGYDLSHVEQFNTGAAPLTDQVIQQLAKRFPNIRIRQAWGMTETTSCLTLTPPDLMTWENASKAGKLAPGTSVRFADPETGETIPTGGTGEIWAKGPQVTAGYLNRPTETASSYRKDGFFRTGDLGSISEDGFITIHDRLKEMIKVRGHAVAPAELEDLLLGIPAVADAAVIGIPHEYSGEVPRAFVVVHNHIAPSELVAEQISSFVKARKPKYKSLAGGIDFVESIPKSPSGKILRRALKDRWLSSVKVKNKIEPKL
ncbi:unnamed protein product [Clonostachys chloroleuca]|uniref:Uncharacterized protein n=1 Tax=Clonostachys chloroleuca TaxID=1926264 RepID=A0AA35MGY0_9HYPO|nr:unnamed protein product [Clonostachys chloroleuca]